MPRGFLGVFDDDDEDDGKAEFWGSAGGGGSSIIAARYQDKIDEKEQKDAEAAVKSSDVAKPAPFVPISDAKPMMEPKKDYTTSPVPSVPVIPIKQVQNAESRPSLPLTNSQPDNTPAFPTVFQVPDPVNRRSDPNLRSLSTSVSANTLVAHSFIQNDITAAATPDVASLAEIIASIRKSNESLSSSRASSSARELPSVRRISVESTSGPSFDTDSLVSEVATLPPAAQLAVDAITGGPSPIANALAKALAAANSNATPTPLPNHHHSPLRQAVVASVDDDVERADSLEMKKLADLVSEIHKSNSSLKSSSSHGQKKESVTLKPTQDEPLPLSKSVAAIITSQHSLFEASVSQTPPRGSVTSEYPGSYNQGSNTAIRQSSQNSSSDMKDSNESADMKHDEHEEENNGFWGGRGGSMSLSSRMSSVTSVDRAPTKKKSPLHADASTSSLESDVSPIKPKPQSNAQANIPSSSHQLPASTPLSELVLLIGKDHEWDDEDSQLDIKTLAKHRLRTVGDLRMLSEMGWRELSEIPIMLREALRRMIA